ncbi:hypothetical protein JCM12214_23830 [Geobacillus vulcani]
MRTIDLNCDFGESFGVYRLGQEEILSYVTSVNIACGFHAGDPLVMRRTVQLAIQHGVAIGAHPGFPDLFGFGRRAKCSPIGRIRRTVRSPQEAIRAPSSRMKTKRSRKCL